MRLLTRFTVLALFLATPATWLFAAEQTLQIKGREKALTLTATEFAALPHTELKLPAQQEKPALTYSGIAMRELLAKVGAPLGDKMRGSGLLTGVIVRSKDNYSVLFALAEFDEAFSNRTIIVADQEDGKPLPPSAAPFRLVTPGDKRGARSARQITSIEVVSFAQP